MLSNRISEETFEALLGSTTELARALAAPGVPAQSLAVYSRTVHSVPAGVVWRAMPDDAAAAARELFAALRAFDQAGVREVWVEPPPPEAGWEGVHDRLRRAAAARVPKSEKRCP